MSIIPRKPFILLTVIYSMRLEHKVLVVLLIVGIFASMTTVAFVGDFSPDEAPRGPGQATAYGTLSVTVQASEPAPEEVDDGTTG